MKTAYRLIRFCALVLAACLSLSSCSNTRSKVETIIQFTQEEVISTLEEAFSGNFSIIATEERREKFDKDEIYCIEYTVTNDKYPGLEFPVYSYFLYVVKYRGGPRTRISRELEWRSGYEDYLYLYLVEQYAKDHDTFETELDLQEFSVERLKNRTWDLNYLYDGYVTIEYDMREIEAFASYIQNNYPFGECEEDKLFTVRFKQKGPTPNSLFSLAEVSFTETGFTDSYENRMDDVQSNCIKFVKDFYTGYEYLPDDKREEYNEYLAEKAKGSENNIAADYFDFPIDKGLYTIFDTELTYYETHGLAVGNVHLLCNKMGLETRGRSSEFEVIGIDGSCYSFRYYDVNDRNVLMRKYLYYKDGVPIEMRSHMIVPFSVIEDVTGQRLVETPPEEW